MRFLFPLLTLALFGTVVTSGGCPTCYEVESSDQRLNTNTPNACSRAKACLRSRTCRRAYNRAKKRPNHRTWRTNRPRLCPSGKVCRGFDTTQATSFHYAIQPSLVLRIQEIGCFHPSQTCSTRYGHTKWCSSKTYH